MLNDSSRYTSVCRDGNVSCRLTTDAHQRLYYNKLIAHAFERRVSASRKSVALTPGHWGKALVAKNITLQEGKLEGVG